jgi:hypothetical protein
MNKTRTFFVVITCLIATRVIAQYEIKKYTINNGGGKMLGGQYQMQGSIGQVDASNTLSQNNYSLNGGFWHKKNTVPLPEDLFKDGFEN